MPAHPFIIPLYDIYAEGGPVFTGHTVVSAEGVAGLYVHKSHRDDAYDTRKWRVSNVAGILVYPGKISSREQAREIARRLSPALCAEVKRGEWLAKDWLAHDPEGASKFRSLVNEVSGIEWKWRDNV